MGSTRRILFIQSFETVNFDLASGLDYLHGYKFSLWVRFARGFSPGRGSCEAGGEGYRIRNFSVKYPSSVATRQLLPEEKPLAKRAVTKIYRRITTRWI